MWRGHNIQTAKRKRRIVDDGTANRDGLTIEFTNKKSIGICLIECLRIVQAGIPAFAPGPFDGHRHVVRGHAANLVCFFRHVMPFPA